MVAGTARAAGTIHGTMTKGQGKVFVLAGALARYGCNELAEQRGALVKALHLDRETMVTLGAWGNFLGGGGIVMALLCLGAAAEVTWKKERGWLLFAVIGLVLLCVGFVVFG